MTLTLLPSCCIPHPWWNSMCLKWRVYLPLNQWLQKLGFTGLKHYQLEGWLLSEKKLGKEFDSHQEWGQTGRLQESPLYHLFLISVKVVQHPFCSRRWRSDSLQVACSKELTQTEAAVQVGEEKKFGSWVLPGLHDRQAWGERRKQWTFAPWLQRCWPLI